MLMTSSSEMGQIQKSPKFPDLDEISHIMEEIDIIFSTPK